MYNSETSILWQQIAYVCLAIMAMNWTRFQSLGNMLINTVHLPTNRFRHWEKKKQAQEENATVCFSWHFYSFCYRQWQNRKLCFLKQANQVNTSGGQIVWRLSGPGEMIAEIEQNSKFVLCMVFAGECNKNLENHLTFTSSELLLILYSEVMQV